MNTYVRKAGEFALQLRWRSLPGLLCLTGALAACLLVTGVLDWLADLGPAMRGAMLGGASAAAATAAGALPVLFASRFSQRVYDAALGFGAGIMLGATAFSLVAPAIAAARAAGAAPLPASAMAGAGVLAGAALILFLDRLASRHVNLAAGSAEARDSLRRAWLFVTAVALHNVPEGLAIGVAYA